jgi:hypothetical protein
MGFLTKPSVRAKTNVIGRTVQFPVQNQGIAQQKAIQDDVIPMNVDYDPITLTLQDWYAAEYTDIFSQKDVNWDDKMELIQTCREAIGRRSDQLVIDVCEAGATNNVGDYSTAFSWLLFRQSFQTLRANGAIGPDMFCLISATAEQQLLALDEITNSDYVNYKAIAGKDGLNGQQIMGVTFIVIPDMTEGGLPLASGTDRDCYMFNRRAIGYGSGIDLDIHVDWVPVKTSWLVNAVLKANAAVIDARGLVEIRISDTATPA